MPRRDCYFGVTLAGCFLASCWAFPTPSSPRLWPQFPYQAQSVA